MHMTTHVHLHVFSCLIYLICNYIIAMHVSEEESRLSYFMASYVCEHSIYVAYIVYIHVRICICVRVYIRIILPFLQDLLVWRWSSTRSCID